MSSLQPNLLGLTLPELDSFCRSIGEQPYRARQIYGWLYGKNVSTFEEMTDLGKELRVRLSERARLGGVSIADTQVSRLDGTTKYLFTLSDGLSIESVLIPFLGSTLGSELEEPRKRVTLCISIQAGCPLDCKFCATATMGFKRNLGSAEIVDQVLQVQKSSGEKVTNIVFMGMGEPMLNYENVMKAVVIIADGMGIGERRITVSTAGWIPGIRRMADEGRRAKLALSLHSARNETRTKLMPLTRKFDIRALRAALEYYYSKTKRFVMYECVFFDGVNDSTKEVQSLIKFAKNIPCKINVIPFHSIAFTQPTGFAATLKPSPRMHDIVDELRSNNIVAMIRGSSGVDIDAACGQLALTKRSQRVPPHRVSEPMVIGARA